jgi:LacI family transcriptional regulator
MTPRLPKKSPRPPSIRDVAEHAGVNMSTVSRFLNKKAQLRPETQARIQAAIAELGYLPAPEHRRKGNRLKSRQTRSADTIALILAGKFNMRWIADYSAVYAYLIDGVRQAVKLAGLNLLLRHAGDRGELERILTSIGIDGYLLLGDEPSGLEISEALPDRPIVKLFGDSFSPFWDAVTYSNIETGRAAARYLVGKGLRRLSFVSFPAKNGVFAVRALAFRLEAEAAGAEVADLPSLTFRDLSEVSDDRAAEEIRELIDTMLAQKPRIEGLFVTQDYLLRLIWPALLRRGIEPCKDLALIGCNNELPYLRSLFPRPASIDIRSEDIGRIAVQQLLWRLQNPGEPRRIILLPPLVVPSQYDH